VIRGDGRPRRVRLRFSASAARYVREKTWHPTQQLRAQADGRLVMSLRVSHFLELKRWVLSYGADCEVLEPDDLREQVREEMRRALQRYG
jgi:predicted DNA-binding transcriptional regulator YafY